MKTKTQPENYSGVCHYCGVVFKSNRSTGKFCCPQHRSLYGKYGSIISPMVQGEDGECFNADECLAALCQHEPAIQPANENRWSRGYNDDWFQYEFGYTGPFPLGNVLLVVGSYLLKRVDHLEEYSREPHFYVKHISHITRQEKATGLFISHTQEENRQKEILSQRLENVEQEF